MIFAIKLFNSRYIYVQYVKILHLGTSIVIKLQYNSAIADIQLITTQVDTITYKWQKVNNTVHD